MVEISGTDHDSILSPTAAVRHAATLIVIDREPAIPRVLMGRRSATARFMPSFDVFPGGAVDDVDHHASVAAALTPLTMAHLCRAASPTLATALAVAAARELLEETGLSLGLPPDLSGLLYLGRAVTPPVSPIRFDARFLVVDRTALTAASHAVPLLQGGELSGLAWHGIDATRTLKLALPTRKAMELLAMRLSGEAPWPDDPDAELPVLLDGRDWGRE